MVTRDAHLKALADKDAIEDAIRHAADPGNLYRRETIDTAGLVRTIRKRYRDALEEHRRHEEDLKHKFEDEREIWCRIIHGQNEASRRQKNQDQQIRNDYLELQFKHGDLLKDNKIKEDRITELAEKIEDKIETCKKISQGSLDALILHDRRADYRIHCIKTKCNEELAEIRAWNVTIQKRLDIARRLQPGSYFSGPLYLSSSYRSTVWDSRVPSESITLTWRHVVTVILFHRAEVGTVHQMYQKLGQMRKTKEKEVAAKDKENEELRNENRDQELEICNLKKAAEDDRDALKKTTNLLIDTRRALSQANDKIENHSWETGILKRSETSWKEAYNTQDKKNTALRSEMLKLKQDQLKELGLAQVEIARLKVEAEYSDEAITKMDRELESWENGSLGALRISEMKQDPTYSMSEARSLANALKAANVRANQLQVSANALQAENGVLKRQIETVANSYNPEIQEQIDRLQSENQNLREAAGRAGTLETELIAQLAEAEQKREERLTDIVRELEAGFTQGFEKVRKLRDQWLKSKREVEIQHYREMVAEDQRRESERRHQDDQLAAAWREKSEELQAKEEELRNQETELANQVSNLGSNRQTFLEMKARAENAENEVNKLRVAAINENARRNLIETKLNNEVQNQIRAAQRHLDLLNEETSMLPEWSRIIDLHNELQLANCSMNNFVSNVTYNETNSETLSQTLYGADFTESDVQLLQGEGRPGLLAQLEAAKRTLDRLRWLLAESPNVDVDRVLSIVMAPRGDEDLSQPFDDFFDGWDGNGQSAPQPNSRKRSGPPLGAPTYGDHEDNAASDDWGDQGQDASNGARLSTPEEVRSRQRILPKSRRNGRPAKTVPLESIDPSIRYQ